MRQKDTIMLLVLIAVVGGGGYWLYTREPKKSQV